MQNENKDPFAEYAVENIGSVESEGSDPFAEYAVKEDANMLESGVRGVAQGATMGFADEIIGGAKAIWEDMTEAFTSEDTTPKIKRNKDGIITNKAELKGNYEKYRDESRADFKHAQESNPDTYLLGDVFGSLFLPIPGSTAVKSMSLAQKATKLGLSGAAIGALEKAGRTEKDLMSKEGLEEVAVGALTGAALGTIVPAAGHGIKKAAESAKKGVKVVDKTLKSRKIRDVHINLKKKFADEGVDIGDMERTMGLQKKIVDLKGGLAPKRINDWIDKASYKDFTNFNLLDFAIFSGGGGIVGVAAKKAAVIAAKSVLSNPEHRVKLIDAIFSSAAFAKKAAKIAKKLDIAPEKVKALIKKNMEKSVKSPGRAATLIREEDK